MSLALMSLCGFDAQLAVLQPHQDFVAAFDAEGLTKCSRHDEAAALVYLDSDISKRVIVCAVWHGSYIGNLSKVLICQ